MLGTSTTCTSTPSSTVWLIGSAIGHRRHSIATSRSATIRQIGPEICRNATTEPSSESGVEGAVGWVERSETHHHHRGKNAMGFASLYPSYETGLTSGKTPRTPSIPSIKNIPLYRNSELRHISTQPGPTKRGGSRVVRNAGRVAVDAAASARDGAGRAGSPCESAAACRRTALSAYGKTVWSWPSLLRSSLCGDVREPNRVNGIVNSRGEGGQRESSAPGRARHKPSDHCAGKAE